MLLIVELHEILEFTACFFSFSLTYCKKFIPDYLRNINVTLNLQAKNPFVSVRKAEVGKVV